MPDYAQYKPEQLVSLKRRLILNFIWLILIVLSGYVLVNQFGEPKLWYAAAIAIAVVLLRFFITNSIREIRLFHAAGQISIVFETFTGKEKKQEFNITRSLNVIVNRYKPSASKIGPPVSDHDIWSITIHQAGTGTYTSALGQFSEQTLRNLEGEIKAIQAKIDKP